MIVATSERLELLMQSEMLAQNIIESDLFQQYVECKHTLAQDKEAQRLIQAFNREKELYEDVQRFGRYHPDYHKVTKSVRIMKREVDMHEAVANFKKAERQLQDLLDEVSTFIGQSVSEFIKVPKGNPHFQSGCGCSSGGSCGCS
ncbi:YlbF family regulator [Bacillus solimangrovi]|uniref:Regulator n=1 Tax=Bacillus solimangrovi TaxID=1305675 RepID=A0A1E5LIM2_9BACI|nr:YlbF family regulator [Bacillus solimangrovi]OEH93925.1 regulator [Bacillus solimangrovi]